VDRRAGIPRIDFAPVRAVRVSGATLTVGVVAHEVDGARMPVTSPARTVVDCFKFQNKIGVPVAVDALRDYRERRQATTDELWRDADRRA
jgi:hypothetical protein